MRQGQRLDGIAGIQPECEARTHDAAEGRHSQSQLQVEFLDARQFLFVRKFPLLRNPRSPREHDPQHANPHANQDDHARSLRQQLHELPMKDRRHQRAEHRRISQRRGHPQRKPQVPHRQSECKSAEPPQHPKEVRPEDRRGRRSMQNRQQIMRDQPGQQPRHHDPAHHPACQPIGFPRPPPHLPIGHIETRRRKPAQPVKEDSQ